MPKLYTPLQIMEDMRRATKENKMGSAPSIGKDGNMATFLNEVVEKVTDQHRTLNLDDFLSWVIGNTFCKKSYDGSYKALNDYLLEFMETIQKQQPNMTYKKIKTKFLESMSFTTMFSCWEQYKQAYRFDEDFIEELMQTKTVSIPIEILTRLPYRCFYLDVEDTTLLDPAIGFFVYVGFDAKTKLPNLGLFYVKEGKTGEYLIQMSCISGKEMLRGGMLEEEEDGFKLHLTNSILNKTLKSSDHDLFESYLFMLQAVLYLCSNKPDEIESPKKKYVYVGKQRKSSQIPTLSLTDIGVRYGTIIRKRKEEVKSDDVEVEIVIKTEPKVRKSVSSHIRKAHWHHYWVGKGRSQLILKWIPPVFVQGNNTSLPVTIHKVKKG